MEDTLYLDHLEEYVQDENKIVTYKWLSRNLEVPVNTAKQMLYSYMVQCKENSGVQLNATYLVSGLTSDKRHQVCIVDEGALEDTKEQFSTLLTVHVYSVQKKKLKDSCSLYMTDYDTNQDHVQDYARWSTIDCTVGSSATINHSRKPVVNPPLPQLSHSKTSIKEEATAKASATSSKPAASKPLLKLPTTKPKSKKPTSSFFANNKSNAENKSAPAKKEAKTENPAPVEKEVKIEPRNEPKQPVQTQPAAEIVVKDDTPKQASSPPAKKPKTKAVGVFEGLHDSEIDDSDTASDDEKPKASKNSKPVKSQSKKKTKPKATKSQTSKGKGRIEDQQAKRKRVQELSSDEEQKEEPPKPVTSNGKRRKKVKRLVPKIYTNEDGEMVTERSWEMVSTDESDGEPVEKKTKPAEIVTKSPAKKKKQASLMNFFKR